MDEVFEFLKKAKHYYIATIDGDQPRVRIFGTSNIFDGKLYIQTGRAKDVSKQIAANPKIELCAFCEGIMLRVAATLVDDTNPESEKSMFAEHPELEPKYHIGDGNTQVFYLKDATATFYKPGSNELRGAKVRTVTF